MSRPGCYDAARAIVRRARVDRARALGWHGRWSLPSTVRHSERIRYANFAFKSRNPPPPEPPEPRGGKEGT